MPAPKFGANNNQANAHRTYADAPKKLSFHGLYLLILLIKPWKTDSLSTIENF